LKDQRK